MSKEFKELFNKENERMSLDEKNEKESLNKFFEENKREYPKLCYELYEKTKDFFDGVNGINISKKDIKQFLEYYDGKDVKVFGDAIVPTWGISFYNKRAIFKPAGVNYLGVFGKITVQTNSKNPFRKEAIFMRKTSDSSDSWVLGISDENNRIMPLTDDILENALKIMLLDK